MTVVSGSVGTAKTRCGRALHHYCGVVAKETFDRGNWGTSALPRSMFIEWLTVASPETCDEREFDTIVREAERASIVIIDDIGTETDRFRTGVPTQRLCHMLNRIEKGFAYITTNKKASVWAETWDARVEDRLLGGQLIEVNAPSFRSEV